MYFQGAGTGAVQIRLTRGGTGAELLARIPEDGVGTRII